MKVKIMCGISGSGKSTYINEHFRDAITCSADHFFKTRDGDYLFDPAKLGEAHGACLRKFVKYVSGRLTNFLSDEIIVDNTNTSLSEIAPYAALALAYGHEVEVIVIRCGPKLAQKRNAHGVPLEVITNQYNRLKTLALPPRWSYKNINSAEIEES